MTISTSRRSSSDPDRVAPGRVVRSLLTAEGAVHIVTSTRRDGDLHRERVGPAELERRRRSIVDLPWTLLDQVHGTEVVHVREPGQGDGVRGDIAVVEAPGAVVGVWAADCAPVVIVAPDGRFAAVHAGWRGLAAGVLDAACDVLGLDPSGPAGAIAVLGPCIWPCCNEFGEELLAEVADGAGVDPASVHATTARGTTSLDVPALVGAALDRRGVAFIDDSRCTGCDPESFSHRMRRDVGRHVVGAWREDRR